MKKGVFFGVMPTWASAVRIVFVSGAIAVEKKMKPGRGRRRRWAMTEPSASWMAKTSLATTLTPLALSAASTPSAVAIVPGVLTARIATSFMFAPELNLANCSIIGTTAVVAWPLGILVANTYLNP